MRPVIRVEHPDGRVEEVELLRDRTVVGRSPAADIRIADNRVSREHCALEVSGSQVFVVDLGGSNGTWIGASKLLSNVREPLPPEAVVLVGPAKLSLVEAKQAFDPNQDLESQVHAPVRPVRPPGGDGAPAAARAAPPVGVSAAALETAERRVLVNPGERASLRLAVTNRSKIVDHYRLSVSGVPPAWITLPRAGLELMPRESGELAVDLHPPRGSRTSAGVHPLTVALLNEQGQLVTEANLDLEIAPYENLVLDIRPNPMQNRSGGALTLTVENQGNVQTEYRVDAIEPSDALDITVEPPTATVAPDQSRQNVIHVRPRKRIWVGESKRLNVTVTVTTGRQSATVSPAYNQLSMVPRWLPVLLLMACCVILPLFAFLAWPEVKPALFPTATPTLTATATLTPVPTVDIPATQTAVWGPGDDDLDGLTNAEEVVLGTLPNSRDTDGDGLTDFDEEKKHGTDPTNRDTDGDTVSDGQEVQDAPTKCTSPIQADTDLDGQRDDLDDNSCVGITPTASPVPDFGLGGQVNNSLDNLDVLEDARMTWVKIQLHYGPGADSRSTVQDATRFKQEGFQLLLSVVGTREDLANGGSGFMQGLAQFLGDLSPVADAIEVWNEPNIDRQWPTGQIDAGDYVEMLRLAYEAIKATDRSTWVISAAPAPTGVNNAGAMSDDRYIKAMVDAGARRYMDCAGIHYNVGATSPGETSGHPFDSDGHYSWYFMPMVELYHDTFNPAGASPAVPLCFTEVGYLSAQGFDLTLAQAGARNFLFAEGTTERDQAAWLEEALLRSCRSGMVQLFIVWNVDFTVYGEDPQAGYAILRPDEDCPSCETLSRAVGILRNEGCMA